MKVTEIQQPYQFAFHDRVSKIPPSLPMFDEIVQKGAENLTREEKNRFFDSLVSNGNGTIYKLLGWAFPFKQFLKRYAVKYNHTSGFSEILGF